MRILGVLGTMVWDTIWREHDVRAPVEEWGGISYALAAADAAAHSGFQVRPIIKLGRDLAERGLRFVRELEVIESDLAISVVDLPNPRVELRYSGSARRSERLRGASPAWAWSDLQRRIEGCDALYVNFITGNELELDCAKELRSGFEGPIYGDMHSLMLATGPHGERSPRPLERWAEWLSCFDAVQVNEDELAMLSSHWGDPWAFAADVVGRETRLLFVTLGARGAAYFMTEGALPLDRSSANRVIERSRVRTGRVSVEPIAEGDPTGCGDVWGVSVFGALLAGYGVEEAMRLANAAARRNVAHRGATGLNRFLRGEIELA